MTRLAAIAQKKRLATLLLRRAKELRNPAYLPFMDSDRRKARILALTVRVKALRRDIARQAREKHGVPLGAF